MSKYNGHANKHTNDVIQNILSDDDELTFFCTNQRYECAFRLSQDYLQKFPLVDFLEVMEYFERMRKYWRNYLTTSRREELGLYGEQYSW